MTSLQLGQGAEGARVTVVSDSALSDYEAFRRGDRFYVKIPLADFATGHPSFRGDGFDDVQVQTAGDGVVISFQLQPGATAHVDQHANRLDVIFFAPNRSSKTNPAGSIFNRVSSSATSGIERLNSVSNPLGGRGDIAGPVPPVSPQPNRANRERVVGPTQSDGQVRAAQPPSSGSRNLVKKAESVPSISNNAATKSASTSTSASTVAPSPTPYSYQPATSTTPAVHASPQPAVNSSTSANTQNANGRGQAAREWIWANRGLLGSLVLLGALLLLAAVFYRRRKGVAKPKRVKEGPVQPKYSPNIGLKESLAADALVKGTPKSVTNSDSTAIPVQTGKVEEFKPRPVSVESAAEAVPASSHGVSRTSALENMERSKSVAEPAMAGSLGSALPQSNASVLSRPSISSPGSGEDHFISEDQDREVFEL